MGQSVLDLKCKVERIMYSSDIYSVCLCRTEQEIPSGAEQGFDFLNGSRTFICTGEGLCNDVGRVVLLSGEWVDNAKYGTKQLRVSIWQDYVGNTRKEIVAYLSSNILNGIGEKTANAIYDRFGADSVKIIETNPRALLEIPGIKEKRLAKMIESFEKNRELHTLTMLLAPHDVAYKTIVRIYRTLGAGAAAQIRANPYVLCDVSYFGFKKADAVALKLGDFVSSDKRIAGAIVFVLKEAASGEGHLYLDKETLINRCCSANVLNGTAAQEVSREQVQSVIEDMADEERLYILKRDRKEPGLPPERCIYLKSLFIHETITADAIAAHIASSAEDKRDWESHIRAVEEETGITLAEGQFEAAATALRHKICVITGGPGTGKTSTLKVILAAYSRATGGRTSIALAAPTGRAARRMFEQTGFEASTLHSYLELKPDSATDFSVPPENEEQVHDDFLIIDEASMIDAHLAAELFYRIIPGKTKVLLLGDTDQLPSVGPGNVLRQMLACPAMPRAKLTKIFRQAEDSVIPHNSARIKSGNDSLMYNAYFKPCRCANEKEGLKAIIQMVSRCAEKGMLDNTQILCPMKNRGSVCTKSINEALHNIVNPPVPDKNEVSIGGTLFRVGDKVMQTRNIQGASNGDIGYITDISGNERDKDNLQLFVSYDPRLPPVEYDYDKALDLEHALAITIHKSQGGEYAAVIVPIFKSMSFFLQRNLLYTAVTRAKTQVVLVTDMDLAGVYAAVRKEDTSKRNTALAALIGDKLAFQKRLY